MKRGAYMISALTLAIALSTGVVLRGLATVRTSESAVAVNSELLAFLSAARAHHESASLGEEAGDLSRAVDSLTRLTELPRPGPGTRPEVDETLADAYARIAELRLRMRDLDAALGAAEKGLSHARGDTFFRGHLFEVRGRIERARSVGLRQGGQVLLAEQARKRALTDFEQATQIHERVIRASLDGGNMGAKGSKP